MRLQTSVRHTRYCSLVLTLLLVIFAGCSLLEELDDSDGPVGRRAKTGDARCFDSFGKAKRYLHKQGTTKKPGWQWHHIVGQNPDNVKNFGARNLHCTDNLIYLDRATHQAITSYYNGVHRFTDGLRLYKWLAQKDFDKQYAFGVKALEDRGKRP